MFADGRPVITKLDWACRRAQIAKLIQSYEAGTLPGAPQRLSGVFKQNGTSATLAITATEGKASITFTPTITYPTGKPPLGGWPLVIGYDGGSIPVPDGVSLDYSYIQTTLADA